MEEIFNPTVFDTLTLMMAVLAIVVFIALQKIDAGYGMMYNRKWGPTISNRIGWIIMEAPAFLCMAAIWICSPHPEDPAACVMAGLFELHYLQRTFIFPLLMRGKSRMPWAIIVMGMIFNTINAYMIGGWLFFITPAGFYPLSWLYSPIFIMGTAIFFMGMIINLHSDHVIRNLRAPGDTRHYIPRKGFYRFVSSANYFGEFTEWVGFAILTCSVPAAVFAIWTFANLAPRAKAIHKRYTQEFGLRFTNLNLKYMIPFMY